MCSKTPGVIFGALTQFLACVNVYALLAVMLHPMTSTGTSILFLKMKWVV